MKVTVSFRNSSLFLQKTTMPGVSKVFKIIGTGRAAAILMAVVLFSCSPVKFVPKGDYLLNDVKVEAERSKIKKETLQSYIRQKENSKILGFAKFYLWLYNLSSKKNNEGWLKKIGEPPVIFDEGLTMTSEERLEQYLNNRGYFRSMVEAEVRYKEKRQKANVHYHIHAGEQYKIREVNYHIGDSALNRLFFQDSVRTLIEPGTPFDFEWLEKHRNKVVDLFRNHGYFFLTNDDIRYVADSSRMEKEIVLDMYIARDEGEDETNRLQPQKLNKFHISVLPGTATVKSGEAGYRDFSDTISWDHFTLYQGRQIRYRPELFDNLLQMRSGSLYRLSAARNTFDAFTRLRQFRFVDLQFNKPPGLEDTPLLDCNIRLAPLSKQAVSFDVEGTNTSGNLGIAGNVNYQHRNVFRGAEIFQLNFKGAMERQQRVVEKRTEYFNTRELGVESNLTFPQLLGPGKAIKVFHNFLPKTILSLGYNFQRRPEYTRTISNVKFGYQWKTSENLIQHWNLLDFNMVHLYRFDPGFIDFIKDLYIKSSFTDHLIMAMNYSLIYNTQEMDKQRNYSYLRWNVESAGNLLQLILSATNQEKVMAPDTVGLGMVEYYRIFNTRFAQYLKTDLEFRRGYIIDSYNSIVGRAFLGIGVPYGNFEILPFEKKYFTGGANGIRAWQVRSLGPGTYRAPENTYPNQSADIKLEANLEYRFQLISFLEGALFLDAGNIWAINEKDNRPGAQFKFDRFYKQLAVGTGTGFRFDFNYFIFRLDVGMKLRDPSEPSGNGWIIGRRKYSSDDFNLSFAIGYPF